MLPINETVQIDGVKYHIESTELGYLINESFIIYKEGRHWKTADTIDQVLVEKLGEKIEDLIWFRANGI